jgi:hypothetical protein
MDDDAARPARHVGAADVTQVAADQPGAGSEADQVRCPHPPSRGGLGVRRAARPVGGQPVFAIPLALDEP